MDRQRSPVAISSNSCLRPLRALKSTLSTAERGSALPGALVFEYLPSDSTIHPQALMAVAVYDSVTWRAVRAEQGPPPGDSVAAKLGRIYVIGLPQNDSQFRARIDEALTEMWNSGVWTRLFNKWLGAQSAYNLEAHFQMPATGRTFQHKKGGFRHDGVSFYRGPQSGRIREPSV